MFFWAICWTNCPCFNASAHSEWSQSSYPPAFPSPEASVREPSTHWSRQDKTVKTLITATAAMESFHVFDETLFDKRTLLPKNMPAWRDSDKRTSGSHYHKRFLCYRLLKNTQAQTLGFFVFCAPPLFSLSHVSQSMELRRTFFLDTVLPLGSALSGML